MTELSWLLSDRFVALENG